MGSERRNTGRGSEGMTAKHSGEETRARRERGRIVGKEKSIVSRGSKCFFYCFTVLFETNEYFFSFPCCMIYSTVRL